MRWQDYIDQDPEVMVGKPVIRGTRITAELILERLGNGATDADILEAYPHLRVEQIRAVQAFAAAAIGSEQLIFSTAHK
jgi:uncharacterized protein (DUF433 family)